MTIQQRYARFLDWAARLGFVFLTACFGVYLSGLLPPSVPLADMPRYWSLPAARYRLALGVEGGWSWFGQLHHGDFLTYLPLAFLSAVVIVSYLAVLPRFFRQLERLLGMLALIQVLVLLVAASGLLRVGGH